jgi:hypothetical protein
MRPWPKKVTVRRTFSCAGIELYGGGQAGGALDQSDLETAGARAMAPAGCRPRVCATTARASTVSSWSERTRASLTRSAFMLFLPSVRLRSRTRFIGPRTWGVQQLLCQHERPNGRLACAAFRQRAGGEVPARRATYETLMPAAWLLPNRTLSATNQRWRRCTEGIILTRRNGSTWT